MQSRLWPYLGGIARQNGVTALEIGGTADHVHLLLAIPATMALARAIQLIKGGSCKWVHEEFPNDRLFAWQSKYGAFSVSVSQLDRVRKYIKNQPEHHRKLTYQEELLSMLERHKVLYDPRYIWE